MEALKINLSFEILQLLLGKQVQLLFQLHLLYNDWNLKATQGFTVVNRQCFSVKTENATNVKMILNHIKCNTFHSALVHYETSNCSVQPLTLILAG